MRKSLKLLISTAVLTIFIFMSTKAHALVTPVSFYYYNNSLAEFTITDHDPFTQNVGEVIDFSDLTNKTIVEWDNDGYDTITFTVYFTAKKIDNGYQKLYLYSTRSNDTDDKINDMELDLNSFSYEYYVKPIAMYIGDKTSNINHDSTDPDYIEDMDRIYIRYGAHGSGDDDWMIKNISVKVTIS